MVKGFESKTQFDYLYDALAQKYPGLVAKNSDSSVFQFSQMPIAANWVTGNDPTAYDIANGVPLNLDGFYVKGDQLDTSYSTLIRSLKPKLGDDNLAYQGLKKDSDDLTNEFQAIADNANKAYYIWAANNTNPNGTVSSKSEWLNDPLGGKSWGDKLNNIQKQVDEVSNEMSEILKSMDAALSDTLANLGTDTMPISRGGTAIKVPSVTLGGNLSGDKLRWDSYPKGQYDFDVVINADSVIESPWKTVYSTKVVQKCWSTSVETKVDTFRIITDNHYNLKVQAVGIQGYQITRGRWYNPAFVTPDAQIVQGATSLTNDSFFGLNGCLHMIPESILVMYKPTITLTISSQTYKQQFEANANLDINWIEMIGFRFSFNGLASLQPVDNGDNTVTLTFRSPDNAVPQILGVTSKVEFNGNK
ncbi:hypothetical protein CLHUN_10540 [Ruminiclostridium hungatei]|uniref:Uncharacterized protein n=1 Tax=Ruminiclostridium hungatei TaxID=48256 RepID=A0A1V4SPJ2_RUMHU|nr:hypothetical protein [Ruminiclostridium hungatei]OPX45167.1 hypothetical protein CLHUN_10540 [Ruminiclostridium hungatei]